MEGAVGAGCWGRRGWLLGSSEPSGLMVQPSGPSAVGVVGAVGVDAQPSWLAGPSGLAQPSRPSWLAQPLGPSVGA